MHSASAPLPSLTNGTLCLSTPDFKTGTSAGRCARFNHAKILSNTFKVVPSYIFVTESSSSPADEALRVAHTSCLITAAENSGSRDVLHPRGVRNQQRVTHPLPHLRQFAVAIRPAVAQFKALEDVPEDREPGFKLTLQL